MSSPAKRRRNRIARKRSRSQEKCRRWSKYCRDSQIIWKSIDLGELKDVTPGRPVPLLRVAENYL